LVGVLLYNKYSNIILSRQGFILSILNKDKKGVGTTPLPEQTKESVLTPTKGYFKILNEAGFEPA